MPVSHENIRAETLIEETPENKGLIMTITITAYDTGLLQVGPRVGDRGPRVVDPTDGWLGVAELLMQKLNELQHRAAARNRGH